ncbi:MAG: dTDP-4-amino-4,6-dideoxygalactose transaminase [Cyanobacteria bacterium P01_F01_bin.86]
MKITFNKPPVLGLESTLINEALASNKLSGDGPFNQKCQTWFEDTLGVKKSLLTPSCTAALEMSALLIDLQPGDEVIMPSYTFVSTANAFALRGAKIVFVDVEATTMNLDAGLLEQAITPKTKAIVCVHYAGVACKMDEIMAIAAKHNLFVVEDAAQAIGSYYKGRPLGTIGHFGTFSFHETKNVTSGGEGGALLINDEQFIERAEIIREKGTNRNQFFRGQVNKYSWVDIGSSFLPSELQAAFLYGQLTHLEKINNNRLQAWAFYRDRLNTLEKQGAIQFPVLPPYATNNAHMFYIKVASLPLRSKLLAHLRAQDITAVFHYIPLHSSDAGRQLGRFHGEDCFTTTESEKLIRLPLFYGISEAQQERVVTEIERFFQNEN